jgi:predicted RNA binding protein YcfA (HicA-like mRNA interferase family)
MNTLSLAAWIRWALVPHKGSHHFSHYVLARQAGRDLKRYVDPMEFCAAMEAAGYQVFSTRGRAIYYAAHDTTAKRTFIRSRYIMCNDSVQHPLAYSS